MRHCAQPIRGSLAVVLVIWGYGRLSLFHGDNDTKYRPELNTKISNNRAKETANSGDDTVGEQS